MHTLRALLYGLAILHLGPGIAFGVLAFGCEGTVPVLGAVCSKSLLASFALLTVGSWLILVAGLAAAMLVERARHGGPTRARLQALLAVLATGALLGAAGTWLTGNPSWWLAIPGALAGAWLFLANPLECAPPR